MIIIKPIITEKSMLSARGGLYTFLVLPGARKAEIKLAVETSFKVGVVAVNTSLRHVPGKSTGSKRIVGSDSLQKIATIKLRKGQSIDLFDLKEGK